MLPPLPLTPGLLISMSIRNDHSFGMIGHFGFMTDDGDSLEAKQIKLIDESFEEYCTFYGGNPIQSQRMEEVTGTGFYSSEREDAYLSMATHLAVRHAIDLCDQFKTTQQLSGQITTDRSI